MQKSPTTHLNNLFISLSMLASAESPVALQPGFSTAKWFQFWIEGRLRLTIQKRVTSL